jgi:pilus assembly protein Flp/PilA
MELAVVENLSETGSSVKTLTLYKPSVGGKPPHNKRQEVRTMLRVLKRFAMDESGATAIEYGLVAAGISVAIITVVKGLGSKLNTTFTSVQNALN